jgi:hypothetical protein
MEILKKILNDKVNREQLIKEFQQIVWNDDNPNEILLDLAYDLDYYQPNNELRKEDPSYYGDEQLEMEIKSAIEKIDKLNFE